jgi:hypothetical protein
MEGIDGIAAGLVKEITLTLELTVFAPYLYVVSSAAGWNTCCLLEEKGRILQGMQRGASC